MLNWDEYNKEETQVAPAIKNTPPEAPKNIEPVTQIKPSDRRSSLRQILRQDLGQRLQRKAMENFDASEGVRELDEMHSGRVQVDDKAMINCKADLNQLVPFKYDWAWQKYLDGSANHWMPQEVNMTADIALWKSEERFNR